MKTQLPDSSKTKKVWQKPTLTVMSSTEQIQGGAPTGSYHEAGQANGKFYISPKAFPAKLPVFSSTYNHFGHS